MFGRKHREEDLDRELNAHLQAEAEESGDWYAARRALGNTALIKESTREAWGYLWLDRLSQDVRYGCRSLRKNPGFATVAVLTAALGIGANTSIFSIVDAVLLRPLPFPHADRLVAAMNVGTDNFMQLGVGDFQYGAWRDETKVFDGIAAYANRRLTITGKGDPEQLKIEVVTPGMLRTLGVSPIMGRDLTPADAAPRGGRVALLSYSFWMRYFGGDASALSQSMTLDGKTYTIAGILPRSFEFPENADISLLIAMPEPAAQPNGGIYFYNVLARLKPNVTTDRAERDLALINTRLRSAYPDRFSRARAEAQTHVVGLHDRLVGNVRPALLVLAGAVALVMLIVCVNICSLLLARAIARQREIAVRVALGAGRIRVLRQLLTEGMLLAGAGGLGGLLLSFGGVKLLRAMAPVTGSAAVPHIENAHIGGAVLAFNLAIVICSGILFGLVPLRRASAPDPEAALKQGTRSASGGPRQRRLENLLIVAETAFALILLAGAGLLIRTFTGLTSIAPGFRPANVTTAYLYVPFWKYPTAERQRALRDSLLEKLRGGPGVDAVGAVSCLPYGGFALTSSLEMQGRPVPVSDPNDNNVAVNYAAGDYLKAIGIRVLQGRAIDDSDRAGRPSVAVVNETLAKRYFPGERILGSRVRVNGVTDWLEIVGVIGDVKQGGLASEPRPEILQPAAQSPSGGSAQMLTIHSTADPRVLVPWLRAQIASVEKDLPVPEILSMETRMASLIATQTFVLRLLGLFAAIAVILAAIGIYSILVYSVEQRSHEIGIRLALGAQPAQIMGLIIGRGLRVSIAGAAAGLAGGLALTRYLKSLLYGVTPHDPMTLALGCVLLVLVAVGAAWLPARRAIHQDAVASLRAE